MRFIKSYGGAFVKTELSFMIKYRGVIHTYVQQLFLGHVEFLSDIIKQRFLSVNSAQVAT